MLQKIKKIDGKLYIYDITRRKYVALTPEEKVRQQIIYLLIKKGYPVNLIKTEQPIKVYGKPKRMDIVVYNKKGLPFMIAECKAPSIKLTNKVLEQIAKYNLPQQAKYLLITNGKELYIMQRNETGNYIPHPQIPNYGE